MDYTNYQKPIYPDYLQCIDGYYLILSHSGLSGHNTRFAMQNQCYFDLHIF